MVMVTGTVTVTVTVTVREIRVVDKWPTPMISLMDGVRVREARAGVMAHIVCEG